MSKTCVAVVDDEAAVRIALGRLLRLAGFEVLACATGEELLGSLASSRPGCVLLDVHMPGLGGLQVQARLRAGNMQLPVIFITASDDPEVARGALQAGGLRVLNKPFSSDELLAAIAFALQSAPEALR